jgi:hypothetical protein
MTEAEWKAAYIKRFLAGPWADDPDAAKDPAMVAIAESMAIAAYAGDPEADPEDAALDELSCWVD